MLRSRSEPSPLTSVWVVTELPSAATTIAAVWVRSTMPSPLRSLVVVLLRPSAKVAFLVLGPMLDFKLYAMYTRIFRPRLIWTIITSVVVQVFLYTLLTHFVIQQFLAPSSMGSSPAP